MPRELINLSLDEVSAVDEPANPGARVLLMKRLSDENPNRGGIIEDDKAGLIARLAKMLGIGREDEGSLVIELKKEEGRMADENVLKALQAKVEKLEAAGKARDAIAKAKTAAGVDEILKALAEDVRAEVAPIADSRKAELERSATDGARAEFAKSLPAALRAPFEGMGREEQDAFMKRYKAEAGNDPVTKALEAVTKTNEALAKEVQTLKADAEIRAAREEFADLDGVVKVDDFAKTVVRLRKSDREAADALVEQTRQAAKVAKANDTLFKSLGHARPGTESDAEQELTKRVRKYREDHPDASEAIATDAVLSADPALYSRLNEEVH